MSARTNRRPAVTAKQIDALTVVLQRADADSVVEAIRALIPWAEGRHRRNVTTCDCDRCGAVASGYMALAILGDRS